MAIKRRKLQTRYAAKKRKYNKSKRSFSHKVLIYILIFFLFFSALFSMILYFKYIRDLPSPSELEDLNIAESSIIYDKQGNELYKIFKEKRTYVGFNSINTNMVNALVSAEDKRFWENPGVDFIGLVRAGIY
jgi:penicillin-binding protein 1A